MPHPWRRFASRLLVLLAIALAAPLHADEPLEPIADYQHLAQPLLEQYCMDCHGGAEPEAGLSLETLDGAEAFQQYRSEWKTVAARVRAGDMPPEGYDAPTAEERIELVEWIQKRLAQLDCSVPQDPGWVTLRRLNRDQYRNTIRDLLSVDFEPDKAFPPDELAYGFDNNGDVLSLTPALLEKYLDAARGIALQAILAPESLDERGYDVPPQHWEGGQSDRADARELWSSGAVEFEHEFPTEGRYLLRATVSADQAGDEPVRMGIVDSGDVIQEVDVHARSEEPESFTFELEVPAGKRRLGVAFLNDYWNDEAAPGEAADRNLHVRKLQVLGPVDEELQAAPEAHRRYFADSPTPGQWRHESEWQPVVRENLARFAARAYRRPAPESEIERLLQLVNQRRIAGDTYQRAMQIAVQVMLVSPRFLFIGSLDEPPRAATGEAKGYPVDEYELASRLSYFLWSSMPDAKLLKLASEGRLRSELATEVNRMLRDPRAEQLAVNFVGQWLGTRLLEQFQPDETQFQDFDQELRGAMAREAEMVFSEIVRENKPITTLINADFTYVNSRLAEHYGLEGVRGKFFRRVPLDNLPAAAGFRGGVITMAGVLAATSNPDRTSPVQRGKWILGELLGEEPPPPPPGVEGLESVASDDEMPKSVRELMELHRDDPSCAVCHVQMDPLGLALENYDMVGRWRTEDRTGPVDASGELPDGTRLEGVEDLQNVLLARGGEFRRCFAEKMLTYALGRGLEYYDECAIQTVVDRLAEDGDRMRTLIQAIVESPPFQQRRFAAETFDTAASHEH